MAAALVLLVVRLVQRSTPQFVLNALFGIGIGWVFVRIAASRGGDEDAQALAYFLPGILYNGVYGLVFALTCVIGWPVVGFMVGSVTGDPTAWHHDKQVVRLCTRLTWLLALPCVLRVAVQGPDLAGRQLGRDRGRHRRRRARRAEDRPGLAPAGWLRWGPWSGCSGATTRPSSPSARAARLGHLGSLGAWLTRPTVLPSESATNAIHSSVPAGPRLSSWCWKMTWARTPRPRPLDAALDRARTSSTRR